MDDNRLVIRQSRVFSFEKKNTELLDIFATFLLSCPIDESAELPAVQHPGITLPFRSITPTYQSSPL